MCGAPHQLSLLKLGSKRFYLITTFGILSFYLLAFSDIVFLKLLCNGNRTEWSPIRSVIIPVITKSDDRAAGVRFVYHEYDYRPNWTTRSLITN